jgi:hypothetical protein
MTEEKTIADFIKENNLSMTVKRRKNNPNMLDSQDMDHWTCTISNGTDSFSVAFSMGRGHSGKVPELADVLDCLASDAAGYENAKNFDDWAGEYGYDTDSRKAEKIFKATEKQSAELRSFLGDAYEALLWNTARL